VLTIRRQIAKRRRSEIIRNLQLTGTASVTPPGQGRHTADVAVALGRTGGGRTGRVGPASIETISSGYFTHGSRREMQATESHETPDASQF